MNVRAALALAVTITLAAGACGGSSPPEEGYVRDKRYEPAHWQDGYRSEPAYGFHCGVGYDGEYDCSVKQYTRQVYEAHHRWIEDQWSLKLELCEPDNGERKCKTGWLDVGDETYDAYALGTYYPEPR